MENSVRNAVIGLGLVMLVALAIGFIGAPS
jgi:hypothetical protein